MKARFALLTVAALWCTPALAQLEEGDKQEPAPGAVLVETSEGATLLTSITPSDYPPPVVIVDGEVVNR